MLQFYKENIHAPLLQGTLVQSSKQRDERKKGKDGRLTEEHQQVPERWVIPGLNGLSEDDKLKLAVSSHYQIDKDGNELGGAAGLCPHQLPSQEPDVSVCMQTRCTRAEEEPNISSAVFSNPPADAPADQNVPRTKVQSETAATNVRVRQQIWTRENQEGPRPRQDLRWVRLCFRQTQRRSFSERSRLHPARSSPADTLTSF